MKIWFPYLNDSGKKFFLIDYVRTPVYIFADRRGAATDFSDVKATNAVIILHERNDEPHEIDIPMD